jgi:hypothetical protein
MTMGLSSVWANDRMLGETVRREQKSKDFKVFMGLAQPAPLGKAIFAYSEWIR